MTNQDFPYEKFCHRLEYSDKKEKRICWFECKEHLDKYISRYNLKKKDLQIKIK